MNLSYIVAHAIAAVGIVLLLHIFGIPWWLAAILNSAFWPVREALEHSDHALVDMKLQWWLEALVPAVVGILLAAVSMWLGLDLVVWNV